MSACCADKYQLPPIDFVGGSHRILCFPARYYVGNRPFDLTGARAQFTMVNFTARNGPPVVTKSMTVALDEDSGINSLLTVELTKEDTMNLFGKFAYQITIVDSQGKPEIPKQGIMNIFRNVDTAALR